MTPQNSKYLFDKFPNLFKNTNGCNSMIGGLDCGDGWYDLIHKLLLNIARNLSVSNSSFSVVQVKEKFGGLRFYVDGGNEIIWDMISKAEADSFGVCENCGTRHCVDTRGKSWIKTFCKTCRDDS